jgi:ABC-type uncharacterized transport system involved in gliding motility auxiliary subunit
MANKNQSNKWSYTSIALIIAELVSIIAALFFKQSYSFIALLVAALIIIDIALILRRRYSSDSVIALFIAGLALISTVLFLITKGLLAIGMFSGATSDTLNRGLLISIGVFILSLAFYVILEPARVRRLLTGRQARYGSNTLVMTIAFLFILGLANYMIKTQRFNLDKRWDLTEDQTHTLAPETLKALKDLSQPVHAVAFFSTPLSDFDQELLDNFKTNGNGKFTYEVVNPDTDPVRAKKAGITGDGKIQITMGDHSEVANSASETELTKTLIKLISPKARTVYFLTGHGEGSLDSGEKSFSTAKQTLENKNYTVKSLNLAAENKIPEDALSVIIAGPLKPVSQTEVDLLKKYVDTGGSLVVMEDPVLFTDFGDSADPLADYLSKDWGITLDKDVIIDLSGQQPLNAVSYSANQHAITQNLSQNYLVIMPQARSLSLTSAPDGITQTPLIQTSPNSWGETNFTNAQGSQISFDDQQDAPGPMTMATAGENTKTKGRVVVFGNSIFAENQGFDAYGNGNIFINSVDWSAEQEDLINITPNTPKTRTFTPPNQIQLLIVLLSSIIIIPGLIVFAGVSTWLARRRQG